MKMREKVYLEKTKNWTQNKWKKEMNLNSIKVGDKVEGMWYPFGYMSGIVEKNEQDLILSDKISVFELKFACSFRKIK